MLFQKRATNVPLVLESIRTRRRVDRSRFVMKERIVRYRHVRSMERSRQVRPPQHFLRAASGDTRSRTRAYLRGTRVTSMNLFPVARCVALYVLHTHIVTLLLIRTYLHIHTLFSSQEASCFLYVKKKKRKKKRSQ